MAKFRVYGVVQVTVWTEVEAEDSESAKEVADEYFGGVSGYCGNGGSDKLIGVCGDDGISADFECPEWTEVEEM